MSSFQVPPQLQNVNVPPQLKSVHGKVQYYVAQIDKEVCPVPPFRFCLACANPDPLRRSVLQLAKYPALVRLEQTTHVPKAYGTLGLFFVIGTAIFFNIAAGFLTTVLGFALPAYFSLRAIETPGKDDDVQWLTYWVSFGFLTILESFSSIILHWVPFYYTFKAIILVWLMLPQTQGAKVVYTKLLVPVFFHKQPAAAPVA